MIQNIGSILWFRTALLASLITFEIIMAKNKSLYGFCEIPSVLIILFFTLFRSEITLKRDIICIPLNALYEIVFVKWMGHGRYIFRELIGNLLLFVPLGLCLSRKEGRVYKYLLPFMISLTIETIQYFTRLGTFEVDDLICNTIGGILGYELGKQISGQRKGNFIIPGIYLAALGLCCLKSILFN